MPDKASFRRCVFVCLGIFLVGLGAFHTELVTFFFQTLAVLIMILVSPIEGER